MKRFVGARRAWRIDARVERELQALADSGERIIVGPWLGEVGFELLYWVPFVAWVAERFGIAADRLVAVSRGGTRGWYKGIASCYYDVFDWVSPAEFRRQHDERIKSLGEQKQRRVSPFEQRLVTAVRERLGGAAVVLHPSTMYELISPYWFGHVGPEWVFHHSRYRKLQDGDGTSPVGHLGTYTAVKFYFNESFPDDEQTRAFVHQIVRTLTAEGPVVLLTTALNVDDHGAVDIREDGLVTLPDVPAPANLAAQSAVVAGARAFVGTYGGFSYLAPFHGVPATAYYVHNRFSPRHLTMARAALASVGSGALLDVRKVHL
jgi:hypothetical protein